jgi:hypothetical protein
MYDEERWLSGMGRRAQHQEAITPTWLKNVSIELDASLHTMDKHRVSFGALKAYILLILSDSHLGVLQQYNDLETNSAIILELLKASHTLPIRYLDVIEEKLLILAGNNEEMKEAIDDHIEERMRQARKEKILPYFVLLLTLALCIFMYIYSRFEKR